MISIFNNPSFRYFSGGIRQESGVPIDLQYIHNWQDKHNKPNKPDKLMLQANK